MMDLLDARGYAIEIRSSSDQWVAIKYLGAVSPEYCAIDYDDDPHVVSRVENEKFTGVFQVVLKDNGIRKSGFKVYLEAEEGTEVQIKVCGKLMCMVTVGAEGKVENSMDVSGLCQAEKEYLNNIHRILYILLGEIDRICEKYNLKYFLVFGGLLGSLRYGEIIPWDDDVDIAMTRGDFEKFKKVAPDELGVDFMYLDCSDLGGGAFLDFMCRVLYMKELVPGNVFRKVGGKCRMDVENRLPLDIYILDKASDSERMHKFHMLMIRGIYGLGMGHRAYINKAEYANKSRMTQISVNILSIVGRVIPLRFIMWLHDKVSTMYEKKETKDYFMSNGFLPFIHTRYSQKWFKKNSIVKLGDMDVSAPADVKAYLKRAYYDYYHYPPVNKRVPAHSPEADGVF